MQDQKLENLLNLALDASPEDFEQSQALQIGYNFTQKTWELIVRYSGDLSPLDALGVRREELLNGYAILTVPEDQVEEMLIQLEGQQERYYERWLRCDPAAFEEFSTGPSGEVYHRLRMVSLLLSGSSFVELEEKEEDKTEITGEVLEREEQKLFHDLSQMWAGMPKVVVRAIMARMLSNLPVCFNSLPEVEDYIESSLGSCTDPDEKMVSVELIREIMVELDEMV